MDLKLKCVFNGKYNVFIIKDDEYIGPTIAHNMEWDGWMRDDISNYYKEGTDILDIGANIGYNSLMFSDYGPVVSFEPVYYDIVVKNARQNAILHSINVFPCALSNDNKREIIYIPSHGCQSNTQINYGGTSFHNTEDMKGVGIEVQCCLLDDIYKGVPSIIKIDVEGHELQVLEGAQETIKKHKPTLMVEIHDYQNNPVAKLIESMGYGTPEKRPEAIFIYTSF